MMNEQEIFFSGAAPVPGGIGPRPLKMAEFKRPEGRPLWFVRQEGEFFKITATDEGKQLYGDPQKGATLAQAWRTCGLYGFRPVCLLASGRKHVATDAIDQVVKTKPQKLVETLAQIIQSAGNVNIPLCYDDGFRGHWITLLKFDSAASRFTYHDPWPGPGYSLLSKEYNAAGVDAQQEDHAWSLTSDELTNVIFAAFVLQPIWSQYMGKEYHMTYDELQKSYFWSSFNIKETARLQNNHTLIFLLPGGYQSEIDVRVVVNQDMQLTGGQLDLNRRWIGDPSRGLNPLGLDIATHFIGTLVPQPDMPKATTLISSMDQLLNPEYTKQQVAEERDETALHAALRTYLGASPSAELPSDYSLITLTNWKDELERLKIEVAIF